MRSGYLFERHLWKNFIMNMVKLLDIQNSFSRILSQIIFGIFFPRQFFQEKKIIKKTPNKEKIPVLKKRFH